MRIRFQAWSALVSTGAFLGIMGIAALGVESPGRPASIHDPGVRGGTPGAGSTFPVLDSTNPQQDAAYKAFFEGSKDRFQEIDSVSGTIPGEDGKGLGPRFNGNSCAQCHAYPAIGGSSPLINPLVAGNFAHLDGAANPVDLSGFLTLHGPVREVRQITDPETGLSDGSVIGLFSIRGRSDAPGAKITQPNFPRLLANHNLSFRIPTPLFGLGLVEYTSDAMLRINLDSTKSQRAAMGIGGQFNYNGNNQTITRFGWKAQNQSLMIFSGEAYNVEQGVTNEIFNNERFGIHEDLATIANSTFNQVCEDGTNIIFDGATVGTAADMSSDIVDLAGFGRMLAPPKPSTITVSQISGSHVFTQVGCQLCHSPSLTTAKAPFPALSNVTYHPYSDFAIHHMGAGLSDGIAQGEAGPDDFRTAPLWGVGQRTFFLHDGRTNNIVQAIQAHASNGSEANAVISRFNRLPPGQQQDLVNFLRSL